MRKLILSVAALAAFAFAPLCADAQTFSRGQTGAVGSVITATDTSGDSVKVVVPYVSVVSSTGGAATGTSAIQVQGNAASAATDSGNPVKVGAKYNVTTPTFTDGQRADLQTGVRGSLHVELYTPDSPNVPYTATNTDAQAGSGALSALLDASRGYLFNGATWDRGFTCPNSAVVNVTAAATTQIVALSASAQVRVCSIALTMSAAGTAKVLYGTGSNCGTGPVDLTGAFTLATGTPLQLSAPEGGSLFRTAASNALCVAAVTGNVTGVITYAQF